MRIYCSYVLILCNVGFGRVVNVYEGRHPAIAATNLFNFSEQEKASIHNYPLDKITSLKPAIRPSTSNNNNNNSAGDTVSMVVDESNSNINNNNSGNSNAHPNEEKRRQLEHFLEQGVDRYAWLFIKCCVQQKFHPLSCFAFSVWLCSASTLLMMSFGCCGHFCDCQNLLLFCQEHFR